MILRFFSDLHRISNQEPLDTFGQWFRYLLHVAKACLAQTCPVVVDVYRRVHRLFTKFAFFLDVFCL